MCCGVVPGPRVPPALAASAPSHRAASLHVCPPPSAAGLPSFWEAAVRSADLQAEVPLERWDVEAGYSPSLAPQGRNIYVRFGAFCSGGWLAPGGCLV